MKRFLLIIVVLLVAGFLVWRFVFRKEEKPQGPDPIPLAVSKHSDSFNRSVKNMLQGYYDLSEAFVVWDTAAVNREALDLRSAIDSLKIDEMQKDTAIYPTVRSQWEAIQSEINGLITDEGLQEKRASFNMLSQQIFDLLRIIQYDVEKVYYQECPMAMNNYESSAYWLSVEAEDDKRRNPYLGTKDPKYGKGMLTCGAVLDSINYVKASTQP